ncbi:hypothetical protein CcaverHIS002_0112570 [Cutaneotrichosporon cavernicola]|nr:hypothetical protein CcaverHIS002_0112570 [Cutaneotrichosporon cavernicola]
MQGLESFIELPQIAPPSTSPPIPHGPLSTPARTLSSDMEATLATPPTNRLALNPLDRIEDELHVHFDEGLAYAVTKSLLGLRQPTQSRRPPQKLRHSLAAISNFVPEAWRRSVEVVEKVKKENKEKTKATTAGINVRHEYGRATAPVAEQQSHESTNVDMGTDAEFTESLESEWETMSEDTEHGEELDQLSGEAIARNVQQHNANLPAEFYRLSPFNTRSYPDTPKPAPHNTQLTPDSSTMAWANHRTPTSAQPSHSHPFGSNTNNWPNAYSHGTGAWAKDPLPDTPTPTRKHSTIREVPRPTAPTPNSVPPSNTNTDNTSNPNQASTSNPSPTICRRITGEYDPVTGPRIRTQILHFRLPDGIPDGMLVNGRAIHIYDQASINDYFSQINGNSGTVGGQFCGAASHREQCGQSTAQSHTTNGGEPAPAAATPAHSILRSLLSPPATQTYPTRRTSRRLPTRLPNPFRPAHGEFGLGRVQQQQDRQRGREQGEDEHQDGQKGKRMPKHKWYDSRRWRN